MGKMLFIRGGAVGDFILTMPAIQLVRSTLPDLEIEVLGYESIAALAVEAGLVDRTRSIEHATMAPFFAPGAKLDEEKCQYFKEFDVVVSYLYDPDGFLAANLEKAGVETLIPGPFRMREEFGSEAPVTAARQLAAPMETLAMFLEDEYVDLTYGGKRDETKSPLVVIHPGSGSPKKNWSLESWAKIAGMIDEKVDGVSFLIVSGEAETETVGDFLTLLNQTSVNYESVSDLSLVEVARRLEGADLFLGHDSGIGHLAASTGIPGIVLFGPTNPGVWAPTHPSFSYIQSPDGQLGRLSVEAVWNDEDFRDKLDAL